MADGERVTLWSPWLALTAVPPVVASIMCFVLSRASENGFGATGKLALMIMAVATLAVAIMIPLRRVVIKDGQVLRTHLFRGTPLSISSVEMDSGSPGPLSYFLGVSVPVVTTSAGERVELDELWGIGPDNPRVRRAVEVLRQIATPKISPSPDRS